MYVRAKFVQISLSCASALQWPLTRISRVLRFVNQFKPKPTTTPISVVKTGTHGVWHSQLASDEKGVSRRRTYREGSARPVACVNRAWAVT
jgi:hypothetical protein